MLLGLFREGVVSLTYLETLREMLKQISVTKFSCDYCHDNRHVYFPYFYEIYYLASIRVPQRLPVGVFTLLADLDASPKNFRTEYDLFQRFS